MISFGDLIKIMEEDQSGLETKAMEVVRAGINISPDFWENFMNLTGNSEGLSELLDVPRHKITNWQAKIQETIDQINKADDEESKQDKSKLLSTGDTIGDSDQPN